MYNINVIFMGMIFLFNFFDALIIFFIKNTL